ARTGIISTNPNVRSRGIVIPPQRKSQASAAYAGRAVWLEKTRPALGAGAGPPSLHPLPGLVERNAYFAAGFSSSLTSVTDPPLIVTSTPSTPPWPHPEPSCQLIRRYLPAGASLISKPPSASVTAKYGWL